MTGEKPSIDDFSDVNNFAACLNKTVQSMLSQRNGVMITLSHMQDRDNAEEFAQSYDDCLFKLGKHAKDLDQFVAAVNSTDAKTHQATFFKEGKLRRPGKILHIIDETIEDGFELTQELNDQFQNIVLQQSNKVRYDSDSRQEIADYCAGRFDESASFGEALADFKQQCKAQDGLVSYLQNTHENIKLLHMNFMELENYHKFGAIAELREDLNILARESGLPKHRNR